MSFPIVGIGASAGGLEAVSELLKPLPLNCGMAFILVQHLEPKHESHLVEILAKRTALRVMQAHDGASVAPGLVYVIPPNADLTLAGERLHLDPRASAPTRHMPVDVLFKSLAAERPDLAIGVVLSGADTDGALGLQAIKDAGGITFAQKPASARFPNMPRAAIATGGVDFVLRPVQIAQELQRLGQHPYLRAEAPRQSSSEPMDSEPMDSKITEDAKEKDALRRIFRRLHSAHGVDFTHYKGSTLQRRLARRMALHRITDPTDYDAAIEHARAGLYLKAISHDVSEERLKRFFVEEDEHYRIVKRIRDPCIFARQDVTRDPPFSRLDLVSCRNLLIYLDAAVQRRVMQAFRFALRPQGFLLLGPAESVGQSSDLRLGQGSEFVVRLPMMPPAQHTAQTEKHAEIQSQATERVRRVLIVDDNEDAGHSIALLVRSWGHEVAVASSGPAAMPPRGIYTSLH